MFKKIIIIICLCFIFGIIDACLIPQDWKYAFGFAVGTFVQMIASIID